MAISEEYLLYVTEQLSGVGRLSWRRMFGGAGLYCGDSFFALIFKDQLYFKVDDRNRAAFEQRGMERFRPYANKPLLSMTYYAVPVDVLEDAEQLREWAEQAVDAALSSARAKAAVRRPRKRKKATPSKKAAAKVRVSARKRR